MCPGNEARIMWNSVIWFWWYVTWQQFISHPHRSYNITDKHTVEQKYDLLPYYSCLVYIFVHLFLNVVVRDNVILFAIMISCVVNVLKAISACSVNCEQNTILSAPSVQLKWFTYSAGYCINLYTGNWETGKAPMQLPSDPQRSTS